MKGVYSTVWYLLLLPLLLLFTGKMLVGKTGYTRDRLARFSIFQSDLTETNLLWHCVSVGEVVCITPLVNKILALHPKLTITISTTTATGAKQVSDSFGERVQHCYLPYDCGWLMRRFLNRIRPSTMLVTEVELWPNLINIAHKRAINIAIINARMTDRSAASYAKLGRFFIGTAEQINVISAQSQSDKENYERLGVSSERIQNNGNIKFELSESSHNDVKLTQLANLAKTNKTTIIVAASTHSPEESMIIKAHKHLIAAGKNIETWLVPRHPQRFDQVANLLEESGIHYLRYSQATLLTPEKNRSRIVLVDAMGVLNAAFSAADIAFIGGSFAEKGGHNALEAALYKLPVVMGPSQFNNPAIYQALAKVSNLKTVGDQSELEKVLLAWCESPAQRLTAGDAGYKVIKQNQGALSANLVLIEELMRSH